jgi:heme/copper-type cytochrome/quinol oxidase subunit 2
MIYSSKVDYYIWASYDLFDEKETTMNTLFAKVFMSLFIVLGFLALVIFSVLCWCVFQARREEKKTREKDAESNSITFDDTPYGKRAG